MPVGADVGDGAAPARRRRIQCVHTFVEDQDAWCSRSAEELVCTDEDGVVAIVLPGPHVDVDVGCRRGEVEAGPGIVRVQDAGDGPSVGADAGDVACGRERTDLAAALPARVGERGFEGGEVALPGRAQRDLDDLDERFAPRDLVGVVLVRPDEHDRTFIGAHGVEHPPAQR